MADDRRIVSGVRLGDEVYTDPDKLAEVATQEQLDYLAERGAITGTWKASKKAKAAEKAKE